MQIKTLAGFIRPGIGTALVMVMIFVVFVVINDKRRSESCNLIPLKALLSSSMQKSYSNKKPNTK